MKKLTQGAFQKCILAIILNFIETVMEFIEKKQKEKLLFTPGPLTTSLSVKEKMLRDLGSRDFEFIRIVKEIRNRLLELGNVKKGNYEAVIMQGSGTFGLESVISSCFPESGKLLIIINGAYGKRINQIAKKLKIDTIVLEYAENEIPVADDVKNILHSDQSIKMVELVHCETTTGIMNPVKEIGEVVNKAGCKYFVDAMSSFGAVPINLEEYKIDYLVSSSNKCIEGVPGFSFILAKKNSLIESKNFSRSVSLDLYEQWLSLEKNGQFRFTPPTHSLLAFYQALEELKNEGGVEARSARYKKNYQTLINGMRKLGFNEYLEPGKQGYIITSFLYPDNANFSFEKLYQLLNKKNFVIYPGKLSKVNCFRIGNIGKITTDDVNNLLYAIEEVLEKMNVKLTK